jgi:hypothetical protein
MSLQINPREADGIHQAAEGDRHCRVGIVKTEFGRMNTMSVQNIDMSLVQMLLVHMLIT